jgi:hypothetical protein
MALRDAECRIMLITSNWIAFNANTRDTDIPPRHIDIVGYGPMCNISLKMTSAQPLSLALRHIRPYQILLRAPLWDLRLDGVPMDGFAWGWGTSFTCRNVRIYDSHLTTGTLTRAMTITATDTLLIDTYQSQRFDTCVWKLKANNIRIAKYMGTCSQMELSAKNISIANCDFHKELTHCLVVQDNESTDITDCVFNSMYSAHPCPNPVLIISKHSRLRFEGNSLKTIDGHLFTDPELMLVKTY